MYHVSRWASRIGRFLAIVGALLVFSTISGTVKAQDAAQSQSCVSNVLAKYQNCTFPVAGGSDYSLIVAASRACALQSPGNVDAMLSVATEQASSCQLIAFQTGVNSALAQLGYVSGPSAPTLVVNSSGGSTGGGAVSPN